MPERSAGILPWAALLLGWLPLAAAAQQAPASPPPIGRDAPPRGADAPAAERMLVPPSGERPPAVAPDPGIVAPTPDPPERSMPLVLPPGGAENPTRPR